MMRDVRRGASVAVHLDSNGDIEPLLHVSLITITSTYNMTS